MRGALCGLTIGAVLTVAAGASGQTPSLPRPDSVYLEDLTWMEVRDAIARGKTTVIVPTGGTEQNGPHMALGKHNFLVQYKAGQVDFNRVALLEQNLVQQQNALAEAQGEIAVGLIQVYRALGGGWQIRCGDSSPPQAEVVAQQPVPPAPSPLPAPKPLRFPEDEK